MKINSFHSCSSIKENTLASMKDAIQHGADMVEFDVQVSKDLVPVLYHEFRLCVQTRTKQGGDLAAVERFDPAAGAWEALAPRAHLAAAALGGKVYAPEEVSRKVYAPQENACSFREFLMLKMNLMRFNLCLLDSEI